MQGSGDADVLFILEGVSNTDKGCDANGVVTII